jgi:hypothetical protein
MLLSPLVALLNAFARQTVHADAGIRSMRQCRFHLVGGTQAQAREESWKKRNVEFPRFTAEEERERRSG